MSIYIQTLNSIKNSNQLFNEVKQKYKTGFEPIRNQKSLLKCCLPAAKNQTKNPLWDKKVWKHSPDPMQTADTQACHKN